MGDLAQPRGQHHFDFQADHIKCEEEDSSKMEQRVMDTDVLLGGKRSCQGEADGGSLITALPQAPVGMSLSSE